MTARLSRAGTEKNGVVSMKYWEHRCQSEHSQSYT